MAAMANALFSMADNTFVPTDFTRGPWSADAQHGGPPASLLAREVEQFVASNEIVSQLEIELLSPVPIAPLQVRAERIDTSRRVARVRATLTAGAEVVAAATALVLRTTDLESPGWSHESVPAQDPPPVSGASSEPAREASAGVTMFHRNSVEHALRRGSFREPGPALDWIRLRLPVVEGEVPTPLQRLAALSDFGSGISAVFAPGDSAGLINTNLVVSVHRYPEGEWISLDATSYLGRRGTGLALAHLGDAQGPVGVATQSLLGNRGRPADESTI